MSPPKPTRDPLAHQVAKTRIVRWVCALVVLAAMSVRWWPIEAEGTLPGSVAKEAEALPEAKRKPVLRVIWDASNEIRSSVVFATVIICMVFVPLLFLQGIEGRFFRPLGIAYIVSTFASLI